MNRCAIAGASLLLAAAPAPREVSQLGWLAGAWVVEDGNGWTEERWAPPRGGVMLGTSLSGRGDEARSYEFMRIATDRQGAIAFWASPSGQPAVRFPLVSMSESEAVFENPAHDYPARIAYRRDGKRLTATLTGPGGANPQIWRYRKR